MARKRGKNRLSRPQQYGSANTANMKIQVYRADIRRMLRIPPHLDTCPFVANWKLLQRHGEKLKSQKVRKSP
jgi:hypothetical protein